MLKITSNSVLASEVAEFLGKKLQGENVVIYGPCTPDKITDRSIVYLNKKDALPHVELKKREEILVLCERDLGKGAPASYIVTSQPELDFVRVINKFFTRPLPSQIDKQAIVEEGAKVGARVNIYAGSFIGADVEIDEGTTIFQNVVITGKVKIGKNCVIKANSTVGSEIFHFVYAKDKWEQFPQVGGIVIGDNVWIGGNTTVEKGSLSDTVIEDGAKIDDLVQIGSGSVIGCDAIVAAGAVICRNVTIGGKCWIAPNASIRENITIGNESTVGLGAVVIADVKAKTVVAGNPAKLIRSHKKT